MSHSAMILCAGFSTRMRPITEDIPKPMVPFLDQALFDFTLEFLQSQGVRSFAVNVHHGATKFIPFLEKYKRQIDLEIFYEEKILGTGGGIFHMRKFVKEDHFFVVNCDFLCEIPLQKIRKHHEQHNCLSTLALSKYADINRYSKVSTKSNHQISSFSSDGTDAGVFSGIHLISKEIFSYKPKKEVFCIIKDVYEPLLSDESIHGLHFKERWVDIGELALYESAQREVSKDPFSWMKKRKGMQKRIPLS